MQFWGVLHQFVPVPFFFFLKILYCAIVKFFVVGRKNCKWYNTYQIIPPKVATAWVDSPLNLLFYFASIFIHVFADQWFASVPFFTSRMDLSIQLSEALPITCVWPWISTIVFIGKLCIHVWGFSYSLHLFHKWSLYFSIKTTDTS